MSLNFEQIENYYNYYFSVSSHVYDILGLEDTPILGNHWGLVHLHNEMIDDETPAKKIREIENLYQKLRKDINQLFEANNLEIRPNYWKNNTMHGTQSFLDIDIDVYKGIKPLLPKINDLISMTKRINKIAKKYNTPITESLFYPLKSSKPYDYFFCGEHVRTNFFDEDLEQIFVRFYQLNSRVNHLLEISNYPQLNQLQPETNPYIKDRYTLFAVRINPQTPNQVILDIINSRQLLESRIKQIIEELAISAPYKIEEYDGCSHLWLDDVDQSINLNMSYDKLKEIIQKLNHYCS